MYLARVYLLSSVSAGRGNEHPHPEGRKEEWHSIVPTSVYSFTAQPTSGSSAHLLCIFNPSLPTVHPFLSFLPSPSAVPGGLVHMGGDSDIQV